MDERVSVYGRYCIGVVEEKKWIHVYRVWKTDFKSIKDKLKVESSERR